MGFHCKRSILTDPSSVFTDVLTANSCIDNLTHFIYQVRLCYLCVHEVIFFIMDCLIMLLAAQVLYYQVFTWLMDEGMQSIWKKVVDCHFSSTVQSFLSFQVEFQFPTFWIFLNLVCKFCARKRKCKWGFCCTFFFQLCHIPIYESNFPVMETCHAVRQ